MLKSYEGYFENGHFYVSGRVMQLPEQRRVFITILDEPAIQLANADDKTFWDEFDRMADESSDENEILGHFPLRTPGMRPPVLLFDEED